MKLLLLFLILGFELFANIGRVYALRGEANVQRENKTIKLKVGDYLKEKDRVQTADRTKMQIVFKDRTIMTLGKNSELSLDEYVYNTASKSKLLFGMKKGILKSITGKLAALNPKNFSIKTENSTIGIRGTTFVLKVEEDATILGTISGTTLFTNNQTGLIQAVPQNQQLTLNRATNEVKVEQLNSRSLKIVNPKALVKQKSSLEIASTTLKTPKILIPLVSLDTDFDTTLQTLVDVAQDFGSEYTVTTGPHFSLGYWENSSGTATEGFVIGDELSALNISDYISNSAFGYYSGSVVGIANGVASTDGWFDLSVDFSLGSVSGYLSFTDSTGLYWDAQVASTGSIVDNGFTLSGTDITDTAVAGGVSLTSGTISATFFGAGTTTTPTIGDDAIGGTFNLTGTSVDTGVAVSATGAFAGTSY